MIETIAKRGTSLVQVDRHGDSLPYESRFQHVARAKIDRRRRAREGGEDVCEWWLGCSRPAVRTRSHSILGEVPICDVCDRKVAGITGEES